MTEAAVVAACIRELKRRGYVSINLDGGAGATGLPDRLVLLGGGRVMGIEFKNPKTGRLSAKQRWTREQWATAGVAVHEIRDVETLRGILDRRDWMTTTEGEAGCP